MTNLNLILAILAFVGIAVMVVGLILNDESYWLAADAYFGIIFAILGIRLLQLRKSKT